MNRVIRLKIFLLLLAIVVGVFMVFIAIDLLGMTLSVLAQEQKQNEFAPHMQPPPPDDDDLYFIAFFTDDLTIPITNLSGNVIGEGRHGGKARCNGANCNQKTDLNLSAGVVFTDPAVIEYKFTNRVTVDPEAERVVVAGTGTISTLGQKERFAFVATFHNNRDGTIFVKYEASNPDASFIIPNAPGAFKISNRR